MTTNASVMVGGEAGPNVARALSEVAHLPVDMAAWDKFTDQGVTDSLCCTHDGKFSLCLFSHSLLHTDA